MRGGLKHGAKRFYTVHGSSWERIGEDFPRWTRSSVREIAGLRQLLGVFYQHLPGPRVLGAGCGPTARDLRYMARRGCVATGTDLVAENVRRARGLTTEGVQYAVADLEWGLPFSSAAFDGVQCVAVVQYIPKTKLVTQVLPAFSRVLRDEGVLLLVFKRGKGIQRVADPKLGMTRTFRLYEPEEILDAGRRSFLAPIRLDPRRPKMWVDFSDERRIPHVAVLLRKQPSDRPGEPNAS